MSQDETPGGDPLEDRIAAFRSFSRFFTRRLGVLSEGLLGSGHSLTEARVLFELAARGEAPAAVIARDLGLDPGYLSRILRRLETAGLVARTRCARDARSRVVSLTDRGRRTFAGLDKASRDQALGLLMPLSEGQQHRLLTAMSTIEALLDTPATTGPPYTLRPHRPGDMGWIVHRHGALYAREYGFDETFEGFVAEIAASFVKAFDPRRERCWIAEKDGEIVGSVLLVQAGEDTAKLRLLYVEPKARGLGIGRRFVDEAIAFARAAGYTRITLWTNDVLAAARHIYEQAGFRLVQREPHRSFGQDLVGEEWEKQI